MKVFFSSFRCVFLCSLPLSMSISKRKYCVVLYGRPFIRYIKKNVFLWETIPWYDKNPFLCKHMHTYTYVYAL